jgi:hypothetical protein
MNNVECNITKFITIFRFSEWIDSKIPFVILAWLIVVINSQTFEGKFIILIQTVSFSFFFLAFGYLFNDWTDRESDILAGKHKIIQSYKAWQIIPILITLFNLSIISIFDQLCKIDTLVITFFCYMFAIIYSGTKLRLKERGFLGLIASSIAQRTLPALLVFNLLDSIEYPALLFLFLTLVVGLRWMITHQLEDINSDKTSQTKTFLIQHVDFKTYDYLVFSLFLEILIIIVIGVLFNNLVVWITYGLYLIYTIIMSFVTLTSPTKMLKDPSVAYLVLSDFYFLFWPIGLSITLSFDNPLGLILIVLNGILLIRYFRDFIRGLMTIFRKIFGTQQ